MQIVHESRDMERLDLRELVKVFGSAPVGKAAGGIQIGSSGMGVMEYRRFGLLRSLRITSRGRGIRSALRG